jgi:hypothetical protein
MKTIRAEPRQGTKVAVIIQVNSTLQEETILTASEGMKLANEILTALPDTPHSVVSDRFFPSGQFSLAVHIWIQRNRMWKPDYFFGFRPPFWQNSLETLGSNC